MKMKDDKFVPEDATNATTDDEKDMTKCVKSMNLREDKKAFDKEFDYDASKREYGAKRGKRHRDR